jgi:acetylglutamate kinase
MRLLKGASARVVKNSRQRSSGENRVVKAPVTNRRRGTVVLKIGGELLEEAAAMAAMARLIVRASRALRLAVVHGGGKEIDAALAQAIIPRHQVDGLRITDAQTLDVVVSVLAGRINTRFVAAINAAGGRAVGLTGADAGVGLVRPARPHRATNGELVDLGLVGEPIPGVGAPLIETLCRHGFVPVVACVGAAKDGRLFNVNADTLAASLAARVNAARLIFAGGTAGVLDSTGQTLAALSVDAMDDLIGSGTASAGMVAKLRAARQALDAGVPEIAIANGRSPMLAALLRGTAGRRRGPWTRLS